MHTKQQIEQWAREAAEWRDKQDDGVWLFFVDELARFAELVAAAERERIAKRFELEPGASRHFASAIRNSAPAAGEDV
jgi:hypothetical protein